MANAKKDPAFLAYVTAWLQSEKVNGMTLEQQGAYWRLLCFSWLHVGIPDNEVWIRNALGGLSEDRFAAIWPAIAPCWTRMPGAPGRLFNERQEHERAERKAKAEEMRRRGQAGGKQSASGRASRDGAEGQADDEAEAGAETKPSTTTGKEGSKEGGTSGSDGTHTDGTAVPEGQVGRVLAARPATMGGPRAAQGGVA